MRAILDGSINVERKKKALEKLVERYYGKLALLQAWESNPNPDLNYIRDLKKRIRTHKNDLIYRGHDDEIPDQD